MSTLLELAEFSGATYGQSAAPTTGAAGEGGTWIIVDTSTTSNGYFGEAWKNSATGEIVISNRGTDWNDGASIALAFTRSKPIRAFTP